MTEYFRSFPASYDVCDWLSRPATAAEYVFTTHETSRLSPAVEVRVDTANQGSWQGRFFGIGDSLSLVVNGPGAETLFVVAAGLGYLVEVSTPSVFRVLETRPIRTVECRPDLNLVLALSFTDVLAVGAGGATKWHARELASDGFTSVSISPETLVVRGFVAHEGRIVETALDLASGVVLHRR